LRIKRKHWPWLACAAVVAAGSPALASGASTAAAPVPRVAFATSAGAAHVADDVPTSATFDVTDSPDGTSGAFVRNGGIGSDSTVAEIQAGGTVDFTDGAGALAHNADFGSAAGVSCVQGSGSVIVFPGTFTKVPQNALPQKWSGDCTFSTPGTYAFKCDVHPTMTGTIVVDAATGTPTPTATATASPTPTATASPTPTPAPSLKAPSATIDAHDFFFQDASQSSPADHTVNVTTGQAVAFAYPSGASTHNVKFTDGQPTRCAQTDASAVPGFDVPPLPAFASAPGWTGECEFDTPGTYAFVCTVHPDMVGDVVVSPPPAPTPAPPPGPPLQAFLASSPKAWAAFDAPSSANATIAALYASKLKLGGRCVSVQSGKVTLTVSKATAKALKLKKTRTVATATARCKGDGHFSVTVKPTKAATSALKRYRKPITVTATLRMSGSGGASAGKRSIKLAVKAAKPTQAPKKKAVK